MRERGEGDEDAQAKLATAMTRACMEGTETAEQHACRARFARVPRGRPRMRGRRSPRTTSRSRRCAPIGRPQPSSAPRPSRFSTRAATSTNPPSSWLAVLTSVSTLAPAVRAAGSSTSRRHAPRLRVSPTSQTSPCAKPGDTGVARRRARRAVVRRHPARVRQVAVKACSRRARDPPAQIVRGIGFDATCSLVALDANDKPVTVSPTGKDEQNIIVWMDHRAPTEQATHRYQQDPIGWGRRSSSSSAASSRPRCRRRSLPG